MHELTHGKQNVVCPYNEILFSHKKEWRTDLCNNVDEPWKHDAKWKKPDTEGHTLWLFLCEMSRIDNSIEKESRVVVARDGGVGRMGNDC